MGPGAKLVMVLVTVLTGGQVDWPPVGPTSVEPVPVPVQSLHVVVSLGKRATGFALASKLYALVKELVRAVHRSIPQP